VVEPLSAYGLRTPTGGASVVRGGQLRLGQCQPPTGGELASRAAAYAAAPAVDDGGAQALIVDQDDVAVDAEHRQPGQPRPGEC
jgi:hypothetical protein